MKGFWGAVRRVAVVCIGLSVILVTTQPAGAHPTRAFDLCGAFRRHGGPCFDTTVGYQYAEQTVFLRGRASPPHSRFTAGVWRQRPRSHNWRRVDSVPISDTGRMRWSWRTTLGDADQQYPYHFQFRIRRHGHSNSLPVLITLGE